MREYEDQYDIANDRELDYCIIWRCNKCGMKREEPVGCNDGGPCYCGGIFAQAGESYNSM